ncbi:MAG: NTP transferase domain-containing protein, partial [Crocinitomicaceae bacterium]|nr:NTP transferase domain-containing protein [Crocinitomicaceae bacterium]
MKVIILAGGLGTRLSEYTEVIPKPMIRIGGRPMLWHIMKIYSHFGIKDFYLALGYKSEVVKYYFLNYKELHSNITVDLGNNSVSFHQTDDANWRITMVDTGANTMTGGRVKQLKDFIGNETCMMTYGDGLANINIDELLKFHKMHGKLITITTVQPQSRYGELSIKKDKVTSFKEKP